MSTKSTRELELEWFSNRSGISSDTTSLSDHKIAYFSSKGFGGETKPLSQMEREWLQSVAGGTANDYPGDLWRSACIAEGAEPGETLSESKRNFFESVTTSP